MINQFQDYLIYKILLYIWNRLTAPHPSITNLEKRWQSYVLNVFAVFAALGHIVGVYPLFIKSIRAGNSSQILIMSIAYSIWALIYGLNKYGYFDLAITLYQILLLAIIGFSVIQMKSPLPLFYLAYYISHIALFVTIKSLFKINLAIIFLAIVLAFSFNHAQLLKISDASLFLIFYSISHFAYIIYGSITEKARRAELIAMNTKLIEAEEFAEEKVLKRTRDLSILAAISKEIAANFNLDLLVFNVTKTVQQSFNLIQFCIYIVNNDHTHLIRLGPVTSTLQPLARTYSLELDTHVLALAGREKKHQAKELIQAEVYANPIIELGIPMLLNEELIGVLGFWIDGEIGFSPEDYRVISTVAEQLSIGIRNIQLFTETQKARRQAELINEINLKISKAGNETEILMAFARFNALDLSFSYVHSDHQGQPTAIEVIAALQNGQHYSLQGKRRFYVIQEFLLFRLY